ncbi:hypothetical protein KY285_007768 [Solanum tuberosum]|nr:hypothetical protein KY285_007768 [Solanum tuberosum]
MRVLVIHKSSVISYNKSRHEGTFQTVILVDNEGTKLQETLFNKHIDTCKDFLNTNKTYYIAKGLLDRVSPNYTSVHKEIELTITDNTIIMDSDHFVSTRNFSNGFVSLEHAEKLPNGVIFDLLCVLVTVNPIIVKGDRKRRKIVARNELAFTILVYLIIKHGGTTVTLWGDFAVNDGAFLEKLKDDQPILGLCDVRVSIYKGTFGISTIPVSSVLINPIFKKELDLRALYRTSFTKLLDIINLTLLPQLLFNEEYNNIATICFYGELYITSPIKREVIKAEKKAITTTPSKVLRKATEVMLPNIIDGKFVDTQKEESMYYRTLVSSKDKEFKFLVHIDMNNSNPLRSLTAQEVHHVEDEAVILMADESKSQTPPTNRANKSNALERHVPEHEAPIIVEEAQPMRP